MISLNDFQRLDLRVAKIVKAEKVEDTDNLLCLELDLGNNEKRQIISGIAKDYEERDLISKQIILVYNLEPRKIKGFESQGMLLAVEDREGKISLVTVDKQVEPGSRVS
jgi:methionyl-tRNA synthetase